nr:hypothetical protein [Cyanobium sp. Morenito 9A2]
MLLALLHADGVADTDREHRGGALLVGLRRAYIENVAPPSDERSGTDQQPPDQRLSTGSICSSSAGNGSLNVIHTSSKSPRSEAWISPSRISAISRQGICGWC